MIQPVTIEVEIQDSSGHKLLHLPNDIALMNSLQVHLEEHMGGLLCMGHYYLPEFKTVFSRGRWVVQITSCCARQMQLLENRLQDIFEG